MYSKLFSLLFIVTEFDKTHCVIKILTFRHAFLMHVVHYFSTITKINYMLSLTVREMFRMCVTDNLIADKTEVQKLQAENRSEYSRQGRRSVQ